MPEAAASNPLAGKAALVTGAAIRVGRAIALALGEAGADVAVHYRSSKAGARAVADEIRRLGRRAAVIEADLARPEDCARTVQEAIRELGGLDFLIHSAANFHRVPLSETGAEVWDRAMNVNARSALLLAREAAPMLKERRGRIVLVSDFLARDPVKNYLAHCVSKAAVEGLTRALAVELAPEVTVNAVAPGTVLLPEGTPPEQGERLARKLPLKRYGSPDDVARTVVFLCGGPSFLTGQVIRVDGGRSLT